MRIARPDDLADLASLGLILAEGNRLLAGVQQELAGAQAWFRIGQFWVTRAHEERRPVWGRMSTSDVPCAGGGRPPPGGQARWG